MYKKICHLTSAHSRYDVRIFHKECVSLAEHGYDVTLIVNDNESDEIKQKIKIVSTGFKAKNRFERFIKAKKQIWEKAVEVDADIYHLHDPDLLPIGNKIKSRGKKVIFDSHEDVPQQIIDKDWIPEFLRKIISKLYKMYENHSLCKYDAVISVTPHIVDRLREVNPNTTMITNYPIADDKEEMERKPEKAICFAGGVGKQWCHGSIIKAIETINDLEYILAGSASNEYLNTLKSLPAWDKVLYLGKISYSDVRNIYNKSMVGMAINISVQAKGEGTLGNTKLFEFMAARLPVICTNYRLWKEVVEGNNCGICVDPENIKEIETAIRFIIDNPEEAKKMGENGRKAVLEKYNWGMQEKVLLVLYEGL